MKKGILAVGGIFAAAAIAGGIIWYSRNEGNTAVDENAVYVSSVSTITGQSLGITNRYAGVVEPQETVEIKLDSSRKVKEVQVQEGEEVHAGQLLFQYDLTSIQESLAEENLNLERLKNEAASLTEQIATLQKEKSKASQDSQLSYTIEIETNKMNLKKNEYDQKSKTAQIAKLQNATANIEVRSDIDGVIQKIDTSKLSTDDGDYLESGSGSSMDMGMGMNDGSNDDAFITILSTGAYRIKGQVNEQNIGSIIPGEPVIVRSRVDDSQSWKGTMGSIDSENASSSNNNNMYGMMSTGSSQTSSSTYPFYVELENSEGLMLGQHVYIEPDNGQDEKKAGLWLSEIFINDVDTENPYVWAASEKNRLEKRSVILGQYDEELQEYEIVEGLTTDDYIAYPEEHFEEGMPTTTVVMMQQTDPDASLEGADPVADDGLSDDMEFTGEMDLADTQESDMLMEDMSSDLVDMNTDESMDNVQVIEDMDAGMDESIDMADPDMADGMSGDMEPVG